MLKKLVIWFDSRLTIAITDWPKWLRVPMLAVTLIGQPVCLILFAVIVAAANISNTPIMLALAAALGAMMLNTTLKHFIHRTRPDTLYVSNMYFKSSSFPSGHAFGGAVVLGLLAYLAAMYVSVALGVLLVLLIASIGISRIYLGAHYPTDVLAGWVFGCAFLWLIIGVFHP
jgi:undecaprenyl-diphosphatase